MFIVVFINIFWNCSHVCGGFKIDFNSFWVLYRFVELWSLLFVFFKEICFKLEFNVPPIKLFTGFRGFFWNSLWIVLAKDLRVKLFRDFIFNVFSHVRNRKLVISKFVNVVSFNFWCSDLIALHFELLDNLLFKLLTSSNSSKDQVSTSTPFSIWV